MNYVEQLYYLVDEYNKGNYDTDTFADEFYRIFDIEMNLSELSKTEYQNFYELSVMLGRYSGDEDDLKIPNVYFGPEDIKRKVKAVKENLGMYS